MIVYIVVTAGLLLSFALGLITAGWIDNKSAPKEAVVLKPSVAWRALFQLLSSEMTYLRLTNNLGSAHNIEKALELARGLQKSPSVDWSDKGVH